MAKLRRIWIVLCLSWAGLSEASYVNFETVPSRPLALSPDGSTLFAVNTPDNRLEIFTITNEGLLHQGSVPVGLEPVAVAIRTEAEVWVVNHLSDSVSIVDVSQFPPTVSRVLHVGDEPWDVVFGGTRADPNQPFPRAFISAARRGQNHPENPKADIHRNDLGRADVWIFDAENLGAGIRGTPVEIVRLFGDKPRPLAASADGSSIYVGIFHSGNQTTAVHRGAVFAGGGPPPPNQNTNGDPAIDVSLIVRRDPNGRWVDEIDRDWSADVPFDLPDLDVFQINADDPNQISSFSSVGTVMYGMAVHPTGRVYVANTEARNEIRFEGPGTIGTTGRGHHHEAQVTILEAPSIITPRHLNKHIPYGTTPVPAGIKEASLSTPVAVSFSPDNSELFVAALGSNKVGVFSIAELDSNSFVPDPNSHIVLPGDGPAGMAVDGSRLHLYVFTRFDNSIHTIDLVTRQVLATITLFNPEPSVVTAGRRFLYDAVLTSSNGEDSCGTCHVFGDKDDLAWDLGNPDQPTLVNPNPFNPMSFPPSEINSMKGPMTTQTLRGLDSHGPMHWRGDRSGGFDPNGDPLDELAAFNAFDVAFEDLLGREIPIDPNDMNTFSRFALTIVPPPNPFRALDNSLDPNETAGKLLFDTSDQHFTSPNTCADCHMIDRNQGFFGTNAESSNARQSNDFKIPHLRNLYDKLGMSGRTRSSTQFQGDVIRGFGFSHDGSEGRVADFLTASLQFDFFFPTETKHLTDFLMVFDSNLFPIVGQQVTLRSDSPPETLARIDLMKARHEAGECELIAKGRIQGQLQGYLLQDPNGPMYLTDKGLSVSENVLLSLAGSVGNELTFTCTYPGGGTRMGLDRNENGTLDGNECGDVNGDGLVVKADADLLKLFLAGVSASVPVPEKCNLHGPSGTGTEDCDLADWVVSLRTARGLDPNPGAGCQ